MKEKKKLVIHVIFLSIIIIGIIVIATLKFNVGLEYSDAKRLTIYLGQDFETTDIREIAKEAFGTNKILVQKIELFNDMASIKVKEIPEGSIDTLVERINEKYGTEYTNENVGEEDIASTRLRDVIKPYVFPITISAVVIGIYLAIRYKKLSSIKVIINTLLSIITIEAVYISLIAIFRIPVSGLTIPIGLLIGIIILLCLVNHYEKLIKGSGKGKKEEKK